MSDKTYVGLWSLGFVESYQESILEDLDTERYELSDGTLAIEFDEDDAREASEAGLRICVFDGGTDVASLDMAGIVEIDPPLVRETEAEA